MVFALTSYELSWLIPTDHMAELLCERLDIEFDYFQLVLEAARKINHQISGPWKRGDYRTVAKLYKQLLTRERHPLVRARLEKTIQLCWKICVEGRG